MKVYDSESLVKKYDIETDLQQTLPVPLYPGLQVHVYEPSVFLHSELISHSLTPSHSLISKGVNQ